jgi:hypothetical protein
VPPPPIGGVSVFSEDPEAGGVGASLARSGTLWIT